MDWKMKYVLIYLAFFMSSSSSERNYPTQSYNFVELIDNYVEQKNIANSLKSASDEEKNFLNRIPDIPSKDLNNLLIRIFFRLSSYKCFRDLKYLRDELKEGSEWALKMLDSFGKPESGILLGNVRWMGEYDECLRIQVPPHQTSSIGGFRGRYCTLKIPLSVSNKSLPLSTAVCLPDTCHPNGNVASIFDNIFKDFANFTLNDTVFGNMTLSCKPTTRTFTAGAIVVICFLSLFGLLALIGSSITIFEYFSKSDVRNKTENSDNESDKPAIINGESGFPLKGSAEVLDGETKHRIHFPAWLERSKPFFNCFCVFTNSEKILNVSNTQGQLPSLHGIRFLSMTWVILCHSYSFCALILRNTVETIAFIDHWYLQIIFNGFYCVDSFFLLSGFLVAYLFFQQCAKTNGKINWVYFYVHRYIRLTPVYAIVLLFYTFLNPYIADGPVWPEGDYDKNCQSYWWWNMLYINNFLTVAKQCIGWSWYLANDMQFYIISPLFLITLWRWPKVGYSLVALGVFATFVLNLTITLVYESFTGLGNIGEAATDLQGLLKQWNNYFDKIYIKPYTRIGPYLIGLALAYFFSKQNNTKKLKWTTLAAGWAVATSITLACLFGLYHQKLSTVEAGFYNGLNHLGFTVGLSWVIFLCVSGQGGVVNSLLSWKVWIPLSRLTYCAFLVHPIVQNGYYFSVRRLMEFSHISLILCHLGFLIIGYAVAMVTTLLFESPVIRLEKYLRSKSSSQ